MNARKSRLTASIDVVPVNVWPAAHRRNNAVRSNVREARLLRSPALGLAALLLMLAGVTACSPQTLSATQTEVPKQIKLTYSVISWPVQFEPGTATLSAGQEQALSNFLSTVKTGDGDEVTFEAGPAAYGTNAALVAERQASVDLVLRSLLMPASVVETRSLLGASGAENEARGGVAGSEVPGADVVVVNVGRYIVSGPSCPDWTKPQADDFSNTPPSNFGCATLTNLARMVANPADLVRGSTEGPADGDYAAQGVAAYHAGTLDKAVGFVSDVGGIQ